MKYFRHKIPLIVFLIIITYGIHILLTGNANFGPEAKQNMKYVNRKKLLLSACKSKGYNKTYRLNPRNLLYSKRKGTVFCFIEKVGCTFWRRTFWLSENVNNSQGYKTIFQVPHYFVHSQKLPTLQQKPQNEAFHILDNSFNAIFVREPFDRLFSAYVDKLFSPNKYYWLTEGKEAIKRVRKNPSDLSMKCGHDLSFDEFIKYLIFQYQNKEKMDIHFSTMHSHCQPCEIQYDFIGHMETFNEDALYLITKTKLLDREKIVIGNKYTARDNIYLVFQDTMENLNTYSACLSEQQMLKRAWDVLKLRGLISKEADFNLNINESIDQMVERALAFTDTQKIPEFKRQRVVEYFRSLGKTTLSKFIEVYAQDFELFGYDPHPRDIFI